MFMRKVSPLFKQAVRQFSEESDRKKQFIFWFKDLRIEDVPLVGGKNASLGEMFRELTEKGVKIPNGFAVSAYAYHYFLREAGITKKVREILEPLDARNVPELQRCGKEVRELIEGKEFTPDLKEEICKSYEQLEEMYGKNVDVAVRSSATAEDLPDASFAGQQETFLNVKGPKQLMECCRLCMASLFTNRAISYRQARGYDHFSIGLSIGVQKMVKSECSGVMFSIDTETGFKDAVLINASWGLGENIVLGAVNPDEFYVFKPTINMPGKRPVISKKLGSKALTMIYSTKKGKKVENVETPKAKREQFCLNDDEVHELARYGKIIEEHYSNKRNKPTPMDMEWAKDMNDKKIYIVQARPETVISIKDWSKLEECVLKPKPGQKMVRKAQGKSVGTKIASGVAEVIVSVKDINSFHPGNILVTDMTDPNWEPIMKKSCAIVTNRGGRTCHAAIISRELGIPCIVGTENATKLLKSGDEITVDCKSGGETGIIWDGKIPFEKTVQDLGKIPELKTKIMMNLANPEIAFETSFLPNSGVGLARMEFIVLNAIKAHPMALLHPEKVSAADQKIVKDLIKGYENGEEYFVEKLANGIGMISAAFYPKPIILRFSDFKTNEYSDLIGGKGFEPKEENPMIGWRGASRYYHEKYEEGFALECKAVKKVREEYGLTNLQVMIPFCRTVKEAESVIATMEKYGLKRGEDGLKVICMCEIPSNVICADEFLEVVDGMSIGSNDLTQLTLGVDRDSATVAHIYDERNLAVKRLISSVIKTCKAKGKYIGICGQAPSDFVDFAEFLVEEGIESMSLNPDTVIKTTFALAKTEKKLGLSK